MTKRLVSWQSIVFLVFLVLALLLSSANSNSSITSSNASGNVTPSDVYRVVDDVYAELLLIQAANFSSRSEVQITNIRKRFPRHVFQKGREVFIKVQQLRYFNGLSVNEAPAIPTQQVTPKNVKVMMDTILEDIRELRSEYGVMKQIESAPEVSGKSPTQVYQNISRVNELVSSLNIPSIVPNDVYRIITTINNVIRDILKTQKITTSSISISPSENKKPKDVFQESLKLITQVDDLCQQNDILCISGGAVAPIQQSGRIRPAEVLELMNNLLADVVQIKSNLGDHSANPLAPDPSGKTPSNVFDEVSRARALIRLLGQSTPVAQTASQSK